MRIGIDARMSDTGIGRYTFSLIRSLAQIDPENDYALFLRREHAARFEPPAPNFRVVIADAAQYSAAEQYRLPLLVRRERLDLMHYPHFNVPLLAPTPYVVTIHDLTHSTHRTGTASSGGRIAFALKRRGYETTIRRAAKRASHVITVSESTRRTVQERLGIRTTRTSVIYEGVDRPTVSVPDGDALRRFGIDRPYFLYVGAAHPHKNLQLLLCAFAGLLRDKRPRLQLVLAGHHEPFDVELKAAAGELELGSAVVLPGRVTEAELSALYDGALAYVFVSLSEGFGLPGLEAMAHGVPVLAAAATSLPEIYGDAASYVDPTDVEGVQAGLQRLVEDDALRSELRNRGRRRVELYSWTQMAERTLGVYREALDFADDGRFAR